MAIEDARRLQKILDEALSLWSEEYEVTYRPMFGGITGYTRGRNFASLSSVGLALKLGPADRGKLLEIDGARPLRYEPDSPPSKQSVLVPDSMLDAPDSLRPWLERSLQFSSRQPMRKKKPGKRR